MGSFNAMSAFDSIDSAAVHPLGTLVEGPVGRKYRYVYNAGADTLAAGEVCCFHTTNTYGHITGTVATSMNNGTAGIAAGVAQAAIPTTKYGWLQTSGDGVQALTTDAGVAQGDYLVVNGGTSPDGTVDTMADGEEECVFAVALAADSSTTQTAGTYTLNAERNW
jgi:hypothetical protein